MLAMVSMRTGSLASRVLGGLRKSVLSRLAMLALFLSMHTPWINAQTGGQGAITGTVQDSTGAVIPNAIVIAHNVDTGVDVQRTSSAAGVYQISPLNVGTYTVTATASGFQKYQQQNIVINQGQTYGLNISLQVGSSAQTVTVSSAPPQLDTDNATLGANLSSDEFLDLPLMVAGNQQRDITSFSNLLPGAQPGSRSSLFSGTANRVQEVYLDGIPLTTISQIGDNRPIFNLVPAEGSASSAPPPAARQSSFRVPAPSTTHSSPAAINTTAP